MDMKEMVQKVKNKEPLYGVSVLDAHMQGVAARNSRYSQVFFHVLPWFNLVNHSQVSYFFPIHRRRVQVVGNLQLILPISSMVLIQQSTFVPPRMN
jgi:hypothetical protein